MKKALLIISGLLTLGLVGCSGDGGETKEVHQFGDWIEEIPATCQSVGVKGHYVCEDCGKYFDHDGVELTSLSIPVADHNYGDWVSEVSSTCISHGTAGHYFCDVCEKFFDHDHNEIDDLILPYGDHAYGTLIPESPSTCQAQGTAAHYFCELCSTYFDVDHKVTTLEDLKLPLGPHCGLHYSANEASFNDSGNLECWYCSTCREFFKERPQGGNWVDEASKPEIPVTSDCFIPSTIESYLAEAYVDGYEASTTFEEKGTYEFIISPTKVNLIEKDEELLAAAQTFKTNAVLHESSEVDLDNDIATWRAAVLKSYGEFIPVQVHEMFIKTYSILTLGVLAHEGQSYIDNVGSKLNSTSTWVYDDPTLGDNRWWVPDCYKAPTIYAYSQTLTESFTTMEDIYNKITDLMIDVALSAGQVIAEALNYYAENLNGKITISGNDTASVWWYVWAYLSTNSTFEYFGSNPEYNEYKPADYRLGNLYNKSLYEGDFSLEKVLAMANWMIAHQVDDMFAGN